MRDFASMKKISDIAYSFTYGASVRKQWKDLVLAGLFFKLFLDKF